MSLKSIPDQQKTDASLLQAIAQRDESALAEAVRLYGGQVSALCVRICFDDLEASGVVSDVFWELWRAPEKVDLQRGSLRCYLLTMARSRSVDRYRTQASRHRQELKYHESIASQLEKHLTEDSMADFTEQAETAAEIRNALARLPRQQSQALSLAFLDGMSHREVAEKLNMPLGSVKTSIRSGLITLKYLLADSQALRGNE
jgi:RNA polymerase sigma-70 factor, ECF subfamily